MQSLAASLGDFAESQAAETADDDVLAEAGVVVFDQLADADVRVLDEWLI